MCVGVCQLSEQYKRVCEELDTLKAMLEKEMNQEKTAQSEKEELQKEKQRLKEHVHSIGREKEEITQDREYLR